MNVQIPKKSDIEGLQTSQVPNRNRKVIILAYRCVTLNVRAEFSKVKS
jgi:hypothetical protein